MKMSAFLGSRRDKSFDPMTILCLESWYFGQIKEVKPILKDPNQQQNKNPVGLTPMTRSNSNLLICLIDCSETNLSSPVVLLVVLSTIGEPRPWHSVPEVDLTLFTKLYLVYWICDFLYFPRELGTKGTNLKKKKKRIISNKGGFPVITLRKPLMFILLQHYIIIW